MARCAVIAGRGDDSTEMIWSYGVGNRVGRALAVRRRRVMVVRVIVGVEGNTRRARMVMRARDDAAALVVIAIVVRGVAPLANMLLSLADVGASVCWRACRAGRLRARAAGASMGAAAAPSRTERYARGDDATR